MGGQLLRGKAVLLLYAFAFAVLGVAGVIYATNGDDNNGSARAGVAPTTPPLLPTRAPAPTQTPPATLTPGPTQPPDRTNCNEIRNTAYRSESERQFFLRSCAATPSAGIGGSGSQAGQPGGSGSQPAPTATPKPPTEVRHLLNDLAAGTLSNDNVLLTLYIAPGRFLDDGRPLDATAVDEILEANRDEFPDPFFIYFDVGDTPLTVRVRAPGKINPAILSVLASIEIVVKTQ